MFESLKQAFRDKFDNATPASSLNLGEPLAAIGSQPPALTLRDTLFADSPLPSLVAHLSPESIVSGPFAVFAQAAHAPRPEAIAALRTLVDHDESRIQLLAWNALRRLQTEPPPELAKQVLGMVVEVAVNGGVDYVAAYADHRARYYNYSGAGIVWETDNPQLNPQIDALLATGKVVAERSTPWDKERPEPPKQGMVRLNVLAPDGLHFGEGRMSLMMKDTVGAHVVGAAMQLMQAMMAIDKQAREQGN